MHPLLKELYDYHHDASLVIDELNVVLSQYKQTKSALTNHQAVFNLLAILHSEGERQHHFNEELILQQLVATAIPLHPRIHDLGNDHNGFDRIASQLNSLASSTLSHREIAAVIDDYIRQYYDHIDGEENIFFPMADKYLTEDDWLLIQSQWQSHTMHVHNKSCHDSIL